MNTGLYLPYPRQQTATHDLPPHTQNSNKPPLICPKSPLFVAFLGKFCKNNINLDLKALGFIETAVGLLAWIRY